MSWDTLSTLIGEQRGEAWEAVTLGGKLATWEMFFDGVKGTSFGAKVKAVCILGFDDIIELLGLYHVRNSSFQFIEVGFI